jgi:hypothetical protein
MHHSFNHSSKILRGAVASVGPTSVDSEADPGATFSLFLGGRPAELFESRFAGGILDPNNFELRASKPDKGASEHVSRYLPAEIVTYRCCTKNIMLTLFNSEMGLFDVKCSK